jgi:bacteriorhodopsin
MAYARWALELPLLILCHQLIAGTNAGPLLAIGYAYIRRTLGVTLVSGNAAISHFQNK